MREAVSPLREVEGKGSDITMMGTAGLQHKGSKFVSTHRRALTEPLINHLNVIIVGKKNKTGMN